MTINITTPRPEQIRAARSLLGWSQQKLAEKANVAISTVADFERGQRNLLANNAFAIRRALEAADILFTDTGVSHGFHWVFMTQRGMSDLVVAFTQDVNETVVDFASIFGTVDLPKVSINTIQCVTQELRSKIVNFIDRHAAEMPHLRRLSKMVTDMPCGEFFLLLPKRPASTLEQYQYERALHQLNHPQEQPLDADVQVFSHSLELYDLCIPRTDKHFEIGNPMKSKRTCRFCGNTKKSGATFKKEAHAIPAALGNKFLKLADECDKCNEYFGTEIEPTLVELLNSQRVFLGIEARGGLPMVKYSDGAMFHDNKDGKRMTIVFGKISEEASGVLSVQLGRGKPIVPQNFYRALSKIALSVIPDEHLRALKKTVKWVRYGETAGTPLPKIASAVVMRPVDPSAQIALYIRKEPHPKLPHVVCEFWLGCYMYVYALPFSEMDEGDLIGFFEEENFKQTFRHYAYVPSWTQQDYSEVQKIQITQKMRISPRNTSSSS